MDGFPIRYLAVLSFCAALTVQPLQALALEEFKLEGTAFLDEEACTGGLQAEGCNLSFYLQGAAAKRLYEGMGGEAKREECTGGLEKSDGRGLHCIAYDDDTYACDFGYHFGERAFAGSSSTC